MVVTTTLLSSIDFHGCFETIWTRITASLHLCGLRTCVIRRKFDFPLTSIRVNEIFIERSCIFNVFCTLCRAGLNAVTPGVHDVLRRRCTLYLYVHTGDWRTMHECSDRPTQCD